MLDNKQRKERLNWVDQTKGLAILGIVLFHFFQNYPERLNLVSLLDRNGAKVGFAAVDIFFVMAGFNTSYVLAFITKKSNLDWISPNWKSWLHKRMLRLYPTYILAVVVSLVLYALFGKIRLSSGIDTALIFMGIAGYQKFKLVNPGFWFFFVILQAYLLTPLIFYVCKNKPTSILSLGIILGILNKIACWAVAPNSQLYGFILQNNFIGSYIAELCLGIYWGFAYVIRGSFRKIDVIVSTGIFIVGLLGYLGLDKAGIDIVHMRGFDMVFTPFLFLVCYLIFDKLTNFNWMNSGLVFLTLMGLYSYQIYLIHQPMYFVLLPFLASHIAFNPYLKILMSMIITALVLIAYVVLFTYVEKLLIKKVGQLASKQI
ncbi:acyltransferase [Funiculus sociatus GB2-A5]|uniref:Acyltransferase n=1 Tax=Funiculus sociatus GB2-A5 TaxID=2933946 RepID=A0ABV0JRA0_9CYAN|nr:MULTISPECIES: acyltransferase [unclassified Trichocoleus]MBD1907712.1 acyltransferase [Trichocoleus sp. FACHB-832]MBD2061307.1 acyltransferase [Trichocoleus sp. FACHB-6]